MRRLGFVDFLLHCQTSVEFHGWELLFALLQLHETGQSFVVNAAQLARQEFENSDLKTQERMKFVLPTQNKARID